MQQNKSYKKRTPFMYCNLCERPDVPERDMNNSGYCCLPCQRDYSEFRRAFKAEHGRFPTLKEFKSDDTPVR